MSTLCTCAHIRVCVQQLLYTHVYVYVCVYRRDVVAASSVEEELKSFVELVMKVSSIYGRVRSMMYILIYP